MTAYDPKRTLANAQAGMPESSRSIAFHPVLNFVLVVCAAIGAYMLIAFVIPATDVKMGFVWIQVSFRSVYTGAFLIFFLCAGVTSAILGWRLWILYAHPESRRSTDG